MRIPQGGELIVILVAVVLLFGARKLPALARSLGASAKEFRKGVEEGAVTPAPRDPDNEAPPVL
jgi:sec-independent protein translocase protein TatA